MIWPFRISAINYCGSSSSTSTASSQDQTYNYWVGNLADNCATLSTASPLCAAQGNITSVTVKDATGYRNNTEVTFYKLTGGMQNWYYSPMNVSGQAPYNQNLNSNTGVATDEILWNFFRHTRSPKPFQLFRVERFERLRGSTPSRVIPSHLPDI